MESVYFHEALNMKAIAGNVYHRPRRDELYLERLMVAAGQAKLVCKATHQRSRNTARAVGKSDG